MPPVKEQHFFNLPYAKGEDHIRVVKARAQFERLKSIRADRGRLNATQERDVAYLARFLETFSTGRRSLDDYRQLYAPADELFAGDITPGYATLSPDQVMLIAEEFPDLTVLYILREPLSRIWSQTRMFARREGTNITTDLDAFKQFVFSPGVTSRSEYVRTIRIWRRYFDDRFHLLFYDDLRADSPGFVANACRILGLDDARDATAYDVTTPANAEPQMPSEYKSIALEMLDGEHRRLARLVGGHAERWLAQLDRAGA